MRRAGQYNTSSLGVTVTTARPHNSRGRNILESSVAFHSLDRKTDPGQLRNLVQAYHEVAPGMCPGEVI